MKHLLTSTATIPHMQVLLADIESGMRFVRGDQNKLLGFSAEIPDAVSVQMVIVQQYEGYRGLCGHCFGIDPHFRLDAACVEGPKIGGLFDLIVLII